MPLLSTKESFRDAWRCQGPCRQVIHNVEWVGNKMYPADGSPTPHFISLKYSMVCSLCHEMYMNLFIRTYWNPEIR